MGAFDEAQRLGSLAESEGGVARRTGTCRREHTWKGHVGRRTFPATLGQLRVLK